MACGALARTGAAGWCRGACGGRRSAGVGAGARTVGLLVAGAVRA